MTGPQVESRVGRRASSALAAVLVVAGLSSAIALDRARDRWYPAVASPAEELYFTQPARVGRMALSFKAILSDVYWIRAVQYFGRTRIANRDHPEEASAATHGYDLLYPLLDVTTTLDPLFNIAYRFGAIFLTEEYPNGPGKPDQAIRLLDKGFAQNPQKWQYLYDKAFLYYWSIKDYSQAAHWFAEAGKIKGSPEWLPGLGAFMLAHGKDRRSSRMLWQQIHDTAEQQYLKDNASFHLRQLDLADVADQLTSLLERFQQRTGRAAISFDPLVTAGWLRGVPLDPDGVPFVVDPITGRVTLDRRSRYAPLPQDDVPAPAAPRTRGPQE